MSTLGDRIKHLRKKRGMTQIELAKRLNVSNAALCQYESGARTPDDEVKLALSNIFGVSVDYLLGNEKQKEKSPSVTDEDIKIALFGGDGDVSDEAWEEVKRFAAYAKEKYGKK